MRRQTQTAVMEEFARELNSIPLRARGISGKSLRQETIDRYRVTYGVTYASLCRNLRISGGSRRSDAGKLRKKEYWEDKIKAVFLIQCQMSDFEASRFCSPKHAISEAVRQGILAEGELSERNYNFWIQKLNLKAEKGFSRFQATHSNHVHQLDFSGSAYFKVLEPTGDGDFLIAKRPPRERLSKVARDEGYKLQMIGLVDDYSGLTLMQYVVARGENPIWIIPILDQMWRGELDPSYPLKGLPDVLYTDNGSFSGSGATTSYLSEEKGVGVKLETALPYNARAKGKIERRWRHVKTDFEMPTLAGRSDQTFTLSQLNRMLTEWCRLQGQKAHRMFRTTREQAYVDGFTEAVRIPQDDSLKTAAKTYECKVDGSGLLRLQNLIYQLPEQYRGQRVFAHKNAFDEVMVEDAAGQLCKAELYAGPHAFGDFKAKHETTREEVAKQRESGQWGDVNHPYAEIEGQKVIPFLPEQKQESKDGVFTVGPRFKNKADALQFIYKTIGIAIPELRRSYAELGEQMGDLLDRTLDRETIAVWANGARDKIWNKQTAYGGGQ